MCVQQQNKTTDTSIKIINDGIIFRIGRKEWNRHINISWLVFTLVTKVNFRILV